MKVIIKEYKRVDKEIDIEFPYYSEMYLSNEYGRDITFCKIEPGRIISIREFGNYTGKNHYTFGVSTHNYITDSSYFEPANESDEEDFNEAKERAFEFIEQFK